MVEINVKVPSSLIRSVDLGGKRSGAFFILN
jgi:hypothetical protein